MLFFSPLLWYPGDRIDVNYDHATETSTSGNTVKEIAAAKIPGYCFSTQKLSDGILVSRTLLEITTRVRKNNEGIYKVHAYQRTYNSILGYAQTKGLFIPTFADPGTWTYVRFFNLPDYLYDTNDLINYYNHLQYDMCGSVDWPIVDKIIVAEDGKRKTVELDYKTKEHRRQLTLELAKDFIEKYNKRKKDLRFVPFGTIQGYSMKTYQESLRTLLTYGYPYIAIGGLPAYSESQVLELLPMIWSEVKRAGYRPGIHLYGRFPSPKHIGTYLKYGITSIDNNSSHIAASHGTCSYFAPEFLYKGNTALIPCMSVKIPSKTGPLLSRIKREKPDKWKAAYDAVDLAFQNFCRFSEEASDSNLKKFLKSYSRMNKMLDEARSKPLPKRTLQEMEDRARNAVLSKGWERCPCDSCKKIKAHIVMVRGHRIRHMFLHNTYVMYYRFLAELEKAKKIVNYPKYDWSEIMELNRYKNIRQAVRQKEEK